MIVLTLSSIEICEHGRHPNITHFEKSPKYYSFVNWMRFDLHFEIKVIQHFTKVIIHVKLSCISLMVFAC